MMIRIECSNCHSLETVDSGKTMGYCSSCGNLIFDTTEATENMINSLREQNQSYRKKRLFNRILFVLLELFSIIFTIVFCQAFAFILDSKVFIDNNWLIYVIWAIIAYIIYHKFEYKIK